WAPAPAGLGSRPPRDPPRVAGPRAPPRLAVLPPRRRPRAPEGAPVRSIRSSRPEPTPHHRRRHRRRWRATERCSAATAVAIAVAGLVTWVPAGPARAAPPTGAGRYSPPVDAPVIDPFRPPSRPFGPGNRGLTYGVAPLTPVRAAGDGEVVFAGP